MFCKTCGKEVNKNAEFCLNCGVNPKTGNAHCYNCGVTTNPEQEICISCGVNLRKNIVNSSDINNLSKSFCRSCGNEVNEKAEICTNCGIKPLNGENYCQNCGAHTRVGQEICTSCGFRLKQTQFNQNFQSTKGDFSFENYSTYYQEEFTKIQNSNEEYQGKFNWATFFLLPIWFFSKGMIPMAIASFLIWLIPYGSLIAGALIARKANYLLYRKEKYGEDLPNDWMIFFNFSKK